eukprot:TRINITY_DN8785_c0_g1_i3.p1 TRINITY_DN8785_c0_g1~~TRINITY_DN8785_c0_g1_i3.p1  ORF type:complete len:204 (+),score=41.62 TRINITY_DN8785_c0_g1_i3:200-811(+)
MVLIDKLGGISLEDDEFDTAVGKLQDIVIEQEFEKLQKAFVEKNCMTFDDAEENKMEYMMIFKEYQKTLESYLMKRLKDELPALDLSRFMKMIAKRPNEIDEQILDLLYSFTDFQLFKDLMLDNKNRILAEKAKEEEKKTGKPSPKKPIKKKTAGEDIGDDFWDLAITGKKSKIYTDETSEGVARPDLGLSGKGISKSKPNKK